MHRHSKFDIKSASVRPATP